MENSVLTSIKKQLGIDEADDSFDPDIILLINAAFAVLHQIGIGPTVAFRISDSVSKWTDFCDDHVILPMAKDYVFLRVRCVFDPPSSGILGHYKEEIDELTWRLRVQAEHGGD